MKNYDHREIEKKWTENWNNSKIFSWSPDTDRENSFLVDTPPPTVSGSLHIGHIFSYTQTDLQVRFQRMCGKNIFYPMGWDDNGLPTERRVQNYYGIVCDPTIPYDENFTPTPVTDKKQKKQPISRQNFIEACRKLTAIDERNFKEIWQNIALSVDWGLQYATIDNNSIKTAQLAFLELQAKGRVYSREAPTMWDIDFQTAIALAEVEERERPGAYHHIKFQVPGEKDLIIATTRPELLPACIAIVAHPEDARYRNMFGKQAISPVFKIKLPIIPADHADPEKGTGIMMICTFGDSADVQWWRENNIPAKPMIGPNGKIIPLKFNATECVDITEAEKNYANLVGLSVHSARQKIVELLGEDLVEKPKPIQHAVKFYEKGSRPLEYISTRQWFIRILDKKEQWQKQGSKISWHPPHMEDRYQQWVSGLNQDWCISRQRYFGVPFPVWYPLNANKNPDYNKPIFAQTDQLPLDPQLATPPGYKPEQRDQPGGFTADSDVMDTWATSSLSPQIAAQWTKDRKKFSDLAPFDIRPQSHEIIRTWAFYTIVQSFYHEENIPWKNACISGWVLDPERKKMSKSKGNTLTPQKLIEEFSADAIRYWAAKAQFGHDTSVDPKVFKIGQKLITKLINAGRFIFTELSPAPVSEITEDLDCSFIASLAAKVEQATTQFEAFDHAHALDTIESSFWDFCDNYLECVKKRAYSEDSQAQRSARATLSCAYSVFLRGLAPILPFACEELWKKYFPEEKSIHVSQWPKASSLQELSKQAIPEDYSLIKEIISQVRACKSQAQKSQRWPLDELQVNATSTQLNALNRIKDDLKRAINLDKDVTAQEGEKLEIEITLSENAE